MPLKFPRLPLFCGGRFFVLSCLAMCLACPAVSLGQFKFREPPNRQLPATLHSKEAVELLSIFQDNRAVGSFQIEGTLTFRPTRARSVTYFLTMHADWLPDCEETKMTVVDASGARQSIHLRKSPDGVFRASLESDGSVAWLAMSSEELNTPIFDQLPLSFNDLLIPYATWEEPLYVGPERFLGRPSHNFRLLNPDPQSDQVAVRLTLDESFAALLRADFHNDSGALIRRLRVGGFKRFGADWMMSEIIWENRLSRDSVRFVVDAFERSHPSLQDFPAPEIDPQP